MVSLLSNLLNNIFERIHRIKCKYGNDDKKYETCGIKYKYSNCFLQYTSSKGDLIEYSKCLCCNKFYQQKFDEKLKEQFLNTCNILTMITISFFYYREKVFIVVNTWMINQ